jgi:hypothetical protein
MQMGAGLPAEPFPLSARGMPRSPRQRHHKLCLHKESLALALLILAHFSHGFTDLVSPEADPLVADAPMRAFSADLSDLAQS